MCLVSIQNDTTLTSRCCGRWSNMWERLDSRCAAPRPVPAPSCLSDQSRIQGVSSYLRLQASQFPLLQDLRDDLFLAHPVGRTYHTKLLSALSKANPSSLRRLWLSSLKLVCDCWGQELGFRMQHPLSCSFGIPPPSLNTPTERLWFPRNPVGEAPGPAEQAWLVHNFKASASSCNKRDAASLSLAWTKHRQALQVGEMCTFPYPDRGLDLRHGR